MKRYQTWLLTLIVGLILWPSLPPAHASEWHGPNWASAVRRVAMTPALAAQTAPVPAAGMSAPATSAPAQPTHPGSDRDVPLSVWFSATVFIVCAVGLWRSSRKKNTARQKKGPGSD